MSAIGQAAHLSQVPAGGAGTRDGSSAANAGASALQIKKMFPASGTGTYWIKPPTGTAVQVYCHMTLDGGGWMMIARTHPSANPTAGTWGWTGPAIGSLSNLADCYQLGIYSMYQQGLRFYQYAFGNQLRNDTFDWGPFIYTVGLSGNAPGDLFTVDSLQAGNVYVTLKSDTSIYHTTESPYMQHFYGFGPSATTANNYFMRDCCTPSSGGYGINPNGMGTTYCNDTNHATYPGPWCRGAALNGVFYAQDGSSSPTNMGGTNQVMLMVR